MSITASWSLLSTSVICRSLITNVASSSTVSGSAGKWFTGASLSGVISTWIVLSTATLSVPTTPLSTARISRFKSLFQILPSITVWLLASPGWKINVSRSDPVTLIIHEPSGCFSALPTTPSGRVNELESGTLVMVICNDSAPFSCTFVPGLLMVFWSSKALMPKSSVIGLFSSPLTFGSTSVSTLSAIGLTLMEIVSRFASGLSSDASCE